MDACAVDFPGKTTVSRSAEVAMRVWVLRTVTQPLVSSTTRTMTPIRMA